MAVSNRNNWFILLLGCLLLPVSAMAADPLKDFDDHSRSLNEYTGKGKWLVVMIWASDCHVCNADAHNYVDFHTFHQDSDATVLGVSMDGLAKKKEAEEFIRRHAVNFPNLIGEPEDVAALYSRLTGGAWIGTPTFLIYSPSGKLMAQQVGAVPPSLIEDFMRRNAENQQPPEKPGS